jgi:hypothetical protein
MPEYDGADDHNGASDMMSGRSKIPMTSRELRAIDARNAQLFSDMFWHTAELQRVLARELEPGHSMISPQNKR